MSSPHATTILHSIESVQVLKELNTDIHSGLTEGEVKIYTRPRCVFIMNFGKAT